MSVGGSRSITAVALLGLVYTAGISLQLVEEKIFESESPLRIALSTGIQYGGTARRGGRRVGKSEVAKELPSVPYIKASQLLQSGHFDHAAESIARSYENISHAACSLRRPERNPNAGDYRSDEQVFQDEIEGLYYTKVPKTASSTLAGINRRISFHLGKRLHGSNSTAYDDLNTSCSHKEMHITGAGKHYRKRVSGKSFLWGSVRDPASRSLSRIYFHHISKKGIPDDDEDILKILRQDVNPQTGAISRTSGFQLQYLSMDRLQEWQAWNRSRPTLVLRPESVLTNVEKVVHDYDFIAVAERLDESLVALQLLLGLRLGDVLSFSSKVGGGFFYERSTHSCIPIQKRTRQETIVEDYLRSDEWQAVNYGDYLLHAAANRSLDLTIDRFGRDHFQGALRRFRIAQRVIADRCKTETFFPCSDDGEVQLEKSRSSCYYDDEGCGYACIDRLAVENNW
mmetsp:Transcript_4585/g.13229  ORF Transcript_4585/g.13229 Transcript_4585/m.13229 type:complete len:456 (-) Transcript_4585:48-1415(-)